MHISQLELDRFPSDRIMYLIQQSAMGYGDLSHTKVIISQEVQLDGIYETQMWDNLHIRWLVAR